MAQEAALAGAEKLRSDMHQMCQQAIDMLKLTWEGFKTQEVALLQQAESLGQQLHQQEKAGTAFAMPSLGGRTVGHDLSFVPLHLERIGDNIELMVRALTRVIRDGIPFTERAIGELHILFTKAIELLECVRDAIATQNRILVHYVQTAGQHYGDMVNEYALSHQQRLIEGLCLPKASSVFVALLDYLKGIVSHISQITNKLSCEAAG